MSKDPDVVAVERALAYAAGTLAHLAGYVNDPHRRVRLDDPDLHEDLREAESWVIDEGIAAFSRLTVRMEPPLTAPAHRPFAGGAA